MILQILLLPLFLFLPFAANADTLEHSIEVGKGDRVVVDLLRPCKTASIDCDATDVTISAHPIEGVLFEVDNSAVVEYQHGGASDQPDYFSYLVSDVQSSEKRKVDVSITVRVPTAKVLILSPAQGATIQGGAVTVEYRITGDGYDHAHIQLNGEGHISLAQGSKSYRFADVEPGVYRVTLSLANSRHKPLTGPGTTTSIEFTIK